MKTSSWLRKLKRPLIGRIPGVRCRTFVSHAYADSEVLRTLPLVLPPEYNLVVVSPIQVPPTAMVSNALLSTIRSCDALIHIDAPASRRSPWVRLEVEAAKRIGLQVHRFLPSPMTLALDSSPPTRLPVFTSWTRKDDHVVRPLIEFMIKERAFDIYDDEKFLSNANVAEMTAEALESRLSAGGYVLAFLTTNTIDSYWVEREIDYAFTHYPNQVILVNLDHTDLRQTRLAAHADQAIDLPLTNGRPSDWRDFDSLVVRLYLLIYRNAA